MARASISLSSGGTAAASQDKECAAPSIRVGQASKVGTRHDDNEDWGLVCTDLFAQASDVLSGLEYAGVPNRKLSVFSVFDGHGGGSASAWAHKRLHKHFAERIYQGNSSANIPRELYASFAKLEAEFCAWSRKKGDTSGTCATMVVNAGDEIFVANAGDSKAIAFTDSGGRVKSVDLNPRHGAELPSERTRILNAGGAISEDGAVYGVLYPSRGFGDIDVKADGKPVVIATPEGAGFEEGSLLPQPVYKLDRACTTTLVVASDGLWDFATDEQVVQLITRNKTRSEAELSKDLIRLARGGGSDDDVTAIVVRLSFPGSC